LEVLRSQHADLQTQVEVAAAALAQHQERDRETEQAQQQFQSLTAENQRLHREVASYVRQIERVERELGDWKQKVGKLQMHNMHLKAALERSSGDNSQPDIEEDRCEDYWASEIDPPATEAPESEPAFVSPPPLPGSGAALPSFVQRSSFG
jgi:chromosome segregation ATPase